MLNEVSESVSDARGDEVGGVAEEDGAVGDRPVPWFSEVGLPLILRHSLSPCLELCGCVGVWVCGCVGACTPKYSQDCSGLYITHLEVDHSEKQPSFLVASYYTILEICSTASPKFVA